LIAFGTLAPITSSGKAVRNDGALALSQKRRTSFAGYSGELKFAAAQMQITNVHPCGFRRTSLRTGMIVIDHHSKFDICWVVRIDRINRERLLSPAAWVLRPELSCAQGDPDAELHLRYGHRAPTSQDFPRARTRATQPKSRDSRPRGRWPIRFTMWGGWVASGRAAL